MYIKKDMDFNDLKENCWSGAVDTLRTIEENGKEDELIGFLEGYFYDTPTITEVNDLLRFEDDYIFSELGISDEEEEEEEEDEPLQYIEGVTEKSMVNVDDMCSYYGLLGCEACPYANVENCWEHFEKMRNK